MAPVSFVQTVQTLLVSLTLASDVTQRTCDVLLYISKQLEPHMTIAFAPNAFNVMKLISRVFSKEMQSILAAHVIFQVKYHFLSDAPHPFLDFDTPISGVILTGDFIHYVTKYHGMPLLLSAHFLRNTVLNEDP